MSEETREKRLIEVAPFLPLDAISVASKADKDKKNGTIKNVHKWFAPMPTPAVRAVLFATLVGAPETEAERDQLLELVERLVPQDGHPPDESTMAEARAAIRNRSPDELPTILDPFCGGGSTLIEAQRLGLSAIGSDLNPVPVLIARTLTELIPQVAGRPPLVGGEANLLDGSEGRGLDGLVSDVKHYSEWVRDAALVELGGSYPPGPNGETVSAWLWARTARCPNPACGVEMPLISDLWLAKRSGASRWLDVSAHDGKLEVKVSKGSAGPKEQLKLPGSRPRFRCARCSVGIADEKYLRAEGIAGRMGLMPLVRVLDLGRSRTFEPFSLKDLPDIPAARGDLSLPLSTYRRAVSPPSYGLVNHEDIYLPRQLAMLECFSEIIARIPEQVREDGGDEVYAKTIASILALALGKLAQNNSTQARWYVGGDSGSARVQAAFSRHALPMVWDFVELNPFAERAANWRGVVQSLLAGLATLPRSESGSVVVRRMDARSAAAAIQTPVVIVTDPPYFDQIPYADLSDYFYVWHRKALRDVHPDLYATIVTPKDEELVAVPHRHDGKKDAAARYFVEGFTETFRSLRTIASDAYPIIIVYAHRQEEKTSLGSASTGWDAMLEAVLAAGLTIEGTLPIRGASSTRQIGQGTNALASYVVMVCRPRTGAAVPATIADFRATLRRRLPVAVDALLNTGESMVDIRQAAIGPGMEVFSQYSQVFDGSDPIRVRRALTIINEELGRLLDEHLGVVDDETRWACQWYADNRFDAGEYDVGRKLAAVYGLGVDGLQDAGIVESGRGRIRLLRRDELPRDWNGDGRTPAWEACQHLVQRVGDGEEAAGRLVATLGAMAAGVRELAQFLTNLAIEKGWSDEAIAYDALVKSWPRIEQLARQADLDEGQLFQVGDSR